jgi:probable HAF family extracellular repeat protein
MQSKRFIETFLSLALMVWTFSSPSSSQNVSTTTSATSRRTQPSAPMRMLPASQPVMKYQLYDVGTLGGSTSVFFNWDYTGGDFTPSPLNQFGQLAGSSNLASDPNLAGSYLWSFGKLQQLPTLPNGNNHDGGSNANGVNDLGTTVGASAYGVISPYNGQPFYHAVSWINGNVKDLGDLGGGDSWANFVNNRGTIVGYAYSTIPDQYSYYGTQFHAATWQGGLIRDLGTLGGTDSEAWTANDKGEIIGIAFLSTPPVPPFNEPQTDAFLWARGKMMDLGNLGGGFSTPSAINQNGQVTVLSFDASNQHVLSYLWSGGKKYVLPTLGGNFVEATTLNDWGLVTGAGTDSSDSNFLAALWIPWLHLQLPLGTISGDTGSIGLGVNDLGVIVGGSGTVTLSGTSYSHAFVWQDGKIRDLNTLIPVGSPLTLNVAYAVNDSGMIAGLGTDMLGDTHAFVLVPDWLSDTPHFVTANSAGAAPGSSIQVAPRLKQGVRGVH